MNVITPAILDAAFQNFNFIFNDALQGVTPMWPRVGMEVPSTTSQENYGWLGQMPQIREWVGDRQYKSLESFGYSIKNKDFESTITIDRNKFLDDQLGLFKPMFAEMGRSVGLFRDQLLFGLLKAGFTTNCYDGQYFFDVDHPVKDANGVEVSVSNVQAGGGPGWFLMDTTRALKPLIWQQRMPFGFQSKTDPATSDRVFDKKEYVYGVDGRGNAGFGLWQLASASKATLNSANFRALRAGMLGLKLDMGRPAGIRPNILLVGPSLEAAARDLINRELIPDGAGGMMSNADYKIVEVVYCDWLD